MRLLTGTITFATLLNLAAGAGAVGRLPGTTAQFLGWGSGAGYHAPIAQVHPPIRRAILHAPGGHWLGGHLFGHSHHQPHFGYSHAAPFGPVHYPSYAPGPGLPGPGVLTPSHPVPFVEGEMPSESEIPLPPVEAEQIPQPE